MKKVIKEVKKEVKKPKVKALPMVRINTRIKKSQQKYIKAEAKRNNSTEGEVIRDIIKFAINNKKS